MRKLEKKFKPIAWPGPSRQRPEETRDQYLERWNQEGGGWQDARRNVWEQMIERLDFLAVKYECLGVASFDHLPPNIRSDPKLVHGYTKHLVLGLCVAHPDAFQTSAPQGKYGPGKAKTKPKGATTWDIEALTLLWCHVAQAKRAHPKYNDTAALKYLTADKPDRPYRLQNWKTIHNHLSQFQNSQQFAEVVGGIVALLNSVSPK